MVQIGRVMEASEFLARENIQERRCSTSNHPSLDNLCTNEQILMSHPLELISVKNVIGWIQGPSLDYSSESMAAFPDDPSTTTPIFFLPWASSHLPSLDKSFYELLYHILPVFFPFYRASIDEPSIITSVFCSKT